MGGELVLVTGGSGFIGAHCIIRLLEAGYRVRATVRSAEREADVRSMVKTGGVAEGVAEGALSFAVADLTADAGWPAAVAGCAFVLHVASPFPALQPKDENELIVPAREGALRVLRAARDAAARGAGVKRVVMTSSFAAIGYGRAPTGRPFTEADWTDVDGAGVSPYTKSKTLAERAAWDFMAREGGKLELAVVNPVAVLGPVLSADYSSSIQLVQRLLEGSVPGLPNLALGVVDVRDVADLHLRAMTNPAAAGERFLAVAGSPISARDLALALKARLGPAGRRVPTRVIPDWVLRVAALLDPSIALVVPELGKPKDVTADKARRLLGWTPRPREEAAVATAESLLKLGLVKGAPVSA